MNLPFYLYLSFSGQAGKTTFPPIPTSFAAYGNFLLRLYPLPVSVIMREDDAGRSGSFPPDLFNFSLAYQAFDPPIARKISEARR